MMRSETNTDLWRTPMSILWCSRGDQLKSRPLIASPMRPASIDLHTEHTIRCAQHSAAAILARAREARTSPAWPRMRDAHNDRVVSRAADCASLAARRVVPAEAPVADEAAARHRRGVGEQLAGAVLVMRRRGASRSEPCTSRGDVGSGSSGCLGELRVGGGNADRS